MRPGATVRDFIDMVLFYRTMAEALKIVAVPFQGCLQAERLRGL